jgi:hypothetical protein
MINEDWERESLKDFIYLQEEMELLRQEINEEKQILAAKILIINEDKIHANEYNNISKVSPIT